MQHAGAKNGLGWDGKGGGTQPITDRNFEQISSEQTGACQKVNRKVGFPPAGFCP